VVSVGICLLDLGHHRYEWAGPGCMPDCDLALAVSGESVSDNPPAYLRPQAYP
jgi:hypothetical protein